MSVVGAAVAALVLSNAITPTYKATAKVLVQRGVTPGTQSLSDIQASQQLALNYSDLIKTRPILEQVVQTVSLPYGPGTLSSKIRVRSPRSLIEITASDPDPKLASDIANTTAQTFINDFLDQQFLQIAQFQSSLAQYGITQDPGIIAAQAGTMSALRLAEDAIPPSSPSSPQTKLFLIVAVAFGLLLAGLVIFVLEYLDDRIKSPDQVKALTGWSTMGSVLLYRAQNGQTPIGIADGHTDTALDESFKFLRTNLQFAALGTQGLGALLVTSSSPEEGKTTTAANLAISIAREGKSVILVDTDLRKPAMHRLFDIRDHEGLTNVILGDTALEDVLTPTPIDNLRVITSGPLPPDATHILGSAKMREVVKEVRENADLVILDSPPLLAVADPMLLTPLVDGVLLVVNTQRTRREALKRSGEHLRQANPPFVGTVLNKVSPRGRGSSYYQYYYYYYYSYGEDGRKHRSHKFKGFGLLSKVLGRGRRKRRHAEKG